MRLVRYRKLTLILTITVLMYIYLWITKYGEFTTENGEWPCYTFVPKDTLMQNSTTGPQLVPHIGNVYDLNKTLPAEAADIMCVPLKSKPMTTICVYPPEKDIYISNGLINFGMWERSMVQTFQHYLTKFPGMGVIDIGSNLGVYTLSAAKAGHKVLAIEPNRDNVIRIHKAASLDDTVRANMKLLLNAVGDTRKSATLVRNNNNQGAIAINANQAEFQPKSDVVDVILMDDLVTHIDFELAIMKIDVEGFEHRALAHAEKLFSSVDIPVVLMEWEGMQSYLNESQQEQNSDQDNMLLNRMVDFFIVRYYKPYSWKNRALQMDQMAQWPRDIVWLKIIQTVFF